MYILIRNIGDSMKVMAVSRKAEPLRSLMKKDAKRIINDYYRNTNESDKDGEQLRQELIASIDAIGKFANYWDDGDSSDLLSYEIVSAPEKKIPLRPIY